MKIAVSATGSSLDAEIDPRFGRCQYFVIVDPDTLEFEAFENPNIMAAGGAGISTAQLVAGKGVQAVITGNVGPNAYQVLSAAGIQILAGVTGKVRDAIQAYRSGQLQASSQASVGPHFGRGMGRGMGMGQGMGWGMWGMTPPSPGPGTVPPGPTYPSREEEIASLKNQAQMLAQQLAEIQRRLNELEKER